MLTAVTSYGRTSASSRVRIFEWLDFLKLAARVMSYSDGSNNSIRALAREPGKYLRRERALRNVSKDLGESNLILSRRASPLSTGHVEKMLLSSARSGVYDFDDALMLRRGRGPMSLISDSRRWQDAVGAADAVIAGNPYLAEAAARFNDNVIVIPSCVNPDVYEEKRDFSFSSDTPVAVWLGSPSTEAYVREIEEPLLQEHRRSGLRLKLVSRGHQNLGSLASMTDRAEWSLGSFPQLLSEADFGIMPLVDSEWAKGKCAYKLLQYGSAGLPSIASPVGANKAAIETFGSLGAMSNVEWRAALADMVDSSASEREEMGHRSRQGVVENYSFSAWGDTWKNVVC